MSFEMLLGTEGDFCCPQGFNSPRSVSAETAESDDVQILLVWGLSISHQLAALLGIRWE